MRTNLRGRGLAWARRAGLVAAGVTTAVLVLALGTPRYSPALQGQQAAPTAPVIEEAPGPGVAAPGAAVAPPVAPTPIPTGVREPTPWPNIEAEVATVDGQRKYTFHTRVVGVPDTVPFCVFLDPPNEKEKLRERVAELEKQVRDINTMLAAGARGEPLELLRRDDLEYWPEWKRDELGYAGTLDMSPTISAATGKSQLYSLIGTSAARSPRLLSGIRLVGYGTPRRIYLREQVLPAVNKALEIARKAVETAETAAAPAPVMVAPEPGAAAPPGMPPSGGTTPPGMPPAGGKAAPPTGG